MKVRQITNAFPTPQPFNTHIKHIKLYKTQDEPHKEIAFKSIGEQINNNGDKPKRRDSLQFRKLL